MRIFDAHCDVLWQMWENPSLSFSAKEGMHVTYPQLRQYPKAVQVFAVYIPQKVPAESRFSAALQMIDIFHERVLATSPLLKLIRSREDLLHLADKETGAILSLEGCDCIGKDLSKMRILYQLGIRSTGITWNYSNDAADGILESRGGGLTSFGEEIVDFLNEKKCWTDVSHLSEKGFWDCIERADYLIASHSNALSLCDNPRNLSDSQINALISKGGRIGITFVPSFLTTSGKSSIKHVLHHLEHVCSLGGADHVGFGSDFDGIEETPEKLSSYKEYEALINEVTKHFSQEQAERFFFDNFAGYFSAV
ncbi:dipeptidase [Fictibacillus iocasae]|uniref:Dipeptidase n=1 Tax=Fictibacillus iocasae TaxID=2715437 RepID=A0ABW2NP58_9BACL